MTRALLDDTLIHPAIRAQISGYQRGIVEEVQAALVAHPVVVVGMRGNPFVGRARRALAAAGVPAHYQEYGSYFRDWRRRSALKMWTGWATFPMVFVRGVLIGGADDLARLIASGELKRLLG